MYLSLSKITYIWEGQEGGSRNPTEDVCNSPLPFLLLWSGDNYIILSRDLNYIV